MGTSPIPTDSGLERYAFCSTPVPDRSRLLFWGFPDDSPSDPLAIAREFEIVEEREDDDTDQRWNISGTGDDSESELNASDAE